MKTRVIHNTDHDDLLALFIDDDGNEVWAVIACPFSPDDPLVEEYYELVNSTGSHVEAVEQLFGAEMIHTKDEYYRLKDEAESLWAKRDALIDQRADLTRNGATFSGLGLKMLNKLSGEIEQLAEAARLIEEQAAEIYNDPQTWDSETSRFTPADEADHEAEKEYVRNAGRPV